MRKNFGIAAIFGLAGFAAGLIGAVATVHVFKIQAWQDASAVLPVLRDQELDRISRSTLTLRFAMDNKPEQLIWLHCHSLRSSVDNWNAAFEDLDPWSQETLLNAREVVEQLSSEARCSWENDVEPEALNKSLNSDTSKAGAG